VVRALEVAIHLRAQKAAREGMIGIAGDADRAAIANRDEHRAGVRAIVGAGTADDRVAVVRVAWLRKIGARGARGVRGGGQLHDLRIRQRGGVANGRKMRRDRSKRQQCA